MKALEQATQRAQAADRMRQEAQAEAAAAGRLRDMQARQLAAANAMVAELHGQVTRLERDSGEAVRFHLTFDLNFMLVYKVFGCHCSSWRLPMRWWRSCMDKSHAWSATAAKR